MLDLGYNQTRGHNHARNRRVHLNRKMYERFGVSLTKAEMRDIVNQIKQKKIQPDKHMSNGFYTYFMKIKGIPMRILYDSYKKQLVTALNPLNHQKENTEKKIGTLGEKMIESANSNKDKYYQLQVKKFLEELNNMKETKLEFEKTVIAV